MAAPRTIREIAAPPLPARIPEVVARLRAIERAAGERDGVGAFAYLYREVTEEVVRAAGATSFADPRFVRRLDVVFANLFLRALRGRAPHAWRPLIACRRSRRIAPIQFALAGMNAHINRDLPVALVETWRALRLDPDAATPQHADFTAVNALLTVAQERVKARFAVGLVGVADAALGRLDDVVSIWHVGRAREAAWVNGEVLWELRDAPILRDEFLRVLDRSVGLGSRALLVPVL